jgi:hypothetical protein
MLVGTWNAARRWAARGTSLSSGGYHYDVPRRDNNHDVPNGTNNYDVPDDSKVRLQRVLETIEALAVAKGLDPLASGMSYREISVASGIPRMTVWRDVQCLVRVGRLVLHCRGLDNNFVVPDDDSPTGCRLGLRMVPGFVPSGATPEQILALGQGRAVVRRQKARVQAARIAIERERLIDESANVVRIGERQSRRRRCHSKDAAYSIPANAVMVPKVKANNHVPKARAERQTRDGAEDLFRYVMHVADSIKVSCYVCGSIDGWRDEIADAIKCRRCHPSARPRNRTRTPAPSGIQ